MPSSASCLVDGAAEVGLAESRAALGAPELRLSGHAAAAMGKRPTNSGLVLDWGRILSNTEIEVKCITA